MGHAVFMSVTPARPSPFLYIYERQIFGHLKVAAVHASDWMADVGHIISIINHAFSFRLPGLTLLLRTFDLFVT